MDSLKVIALTGQAGSGKTEVAKHLVANHGYTRVRFADPLKDMLRTLGLTESEVDGERKELPCSLLFGKTPRHAMQTLGTEWGRNLIDRNLWANAWRCRVLENLKGGNKVVCDDCRFKNEGTYVLSFIGAQVWKILRKDLPAPMDHPSEQELDSIPSDRVIKNYSSIGDLKLAVDNIFAQH